MSDLKLELKELLDILESRISRLNWGWNFITAVYLAIITIVLNIRTKSIPLELPQKIALASLLATIFLINLGGIRFATNEILCLEKDIKSLLASSNVGENSSYLKLLKARSFNNLRIKTIGIHIAIDVVIVALILFYA